MNTFNTMKWLLKREYWENKGMFFVAPVRLGLVLITLLAAIMIYTQGHSFSVENVHVNVTQATEHQAEIAAIIANNYLSGATPLFVMFGFIVFFYCLGAMFEERRDRSILFWKSLPVSDQMTVLSKAVMALVVAPLIVIVIGIAMSFVMLFMICIGAAFHGLNFFGLLLSDSNFYLTPIRLIGMWPIYVLWAVPTVGWLLMVSAWARSRVFLWAVGAPLISLVVAKMADAMFHLNLDVAWFAKNVVARILGGLFPGAWTTLDQMSRDGMLVHRLQDSDLGNMLSQSWMSLGHPSVWLGVAAGVAMMYAAVKLRRWRDES